MGRIELAAAVVVSAIMIVLGLYLGLANIGTDAGIFGWLLAIVGGVALPVNVALRSWMR